MQTNKKESDMTLAQSQKIESMRLETTNDFLKEMAVVQREIMNQDIESAKFRLACIADEVAGWCCDEDFGVAELIESTRDLLIRMPIKVGV